jgi:transposase
MMNQGIFNCEILLRLLREQGYQGGHTNLKDYVKNFRPPKQAPAVPRYETKPGEYAQVDWGLCEYVYGKDDRRHIKSPIRAISKG